jgi:hypothetical protein
MTPRQLRLVRLGIGLFLPALLFGCALPPATRRDAYELDLAGPTLMSRVENGYELKNRHVRLVIDENTGDVSFWGDAAGGANLVPRGVVARAVITAEPHARSNPPQGYVEQRDEQTWQYIGEDPEGFGWRKIYCLDSDALYVTCLVQNLRDQPIAIRIEVKPGFEAAGLTSPGPLTLQVQTDRHVATLHAFNQGAVPQSDDSLTSDPHELKPAERISFTMGWALLCTP